MREIKFRAYSRSNKALLDVMNIDFNMELVTVRDLMGPQNIQFMDCVLEQYTGLKDKNGKEIYEGDILKCIEPIGLGKIRVSFYKVIFNNSSAQFQLQSLKEKYMLWSFYSGGISSDPLVVIGDIHNNADSLEVSE